MSDDRLALTREDAIVAIMETAREADEALHPRYSFVVECAEALRVLGATEAEIRSAQGIPG